MNRSDTIPGVSYSLPEKIRMRLDMLVSALLMLPLRAWHGRHIQGPLLARFGRGLFVTLRGNATLRFGRISARRNLSLLCVGGDITIGDDVFINQNCTFNAMSSIRIGANTMFGENVKVYDSNHAVTEDGTPSPDQYVVAPVSIGNHCWIGSNVIILKGVTRCDRVIVGANAVVAKSILEPGIYVPDGSSRLKKL